MNKKAKILHFKKITIPMIYESFKTFKTKLLTFFSNEIIPSNYKINEYTVHL